MVKMTLIKDNKEYIVYDDTDYETAERFLSEAFAEGAVYVVENDAENIYIDVEKYDIVKLMKID